MKLPKREKAVRSNAPLIRRPGVLFAGAGVLVIAVGWWFGWMTPEASKLTSVRAQELAQQQTQIQLTSELNTLKIEATQVRASLPLLKRFQAAIPAQPDAPDLVVQVYDLATADGVNLASITDDSVAAVTGYSTIPVGLSISGPHDNLLKFIGGLYKLPRLLTIQTVTLSGEGNINGSSSGAYTASIQATAYTTEVPGVATTTAAS